MGFSVTICGAAGEVTGSQYLIEAGKHKVLLECGLYQGGGACDPRNRAPFPVNPNELDAVILSHAHIDHSGRLPLLVARGFNGPVFTHHATIALSEVMLPDSGGIHERRAGDCDPQVDGSNAEEPLYTRRDAERCLAFFRGVEFDEPLKVVPGLSAVFHDAGHILGAAIVELIWQSGDQRKSLVFSGDLGTRGGPVMRDPQSINHADVVMLESTYGDRCHRSLDDTLAELQEIFAAARASHGNVLIPSFAVGRTQDILTVFSHHLDDWQLDRWKIFLDSPMAIEATEIYRRYRHLYQPRRSDDIGSKLPNFAATRTPAESMAINGISSGAIIIAGSGMCNGGRILHHLRRNISRPECHLVFVGFQARGTLGRQIVDGAESIPLWGNHYPVRARVHTVGGLSAHADQAELLDWYGAFENRPPVYLVHGEDGARMALKERAFERFGNLPTLAEIGQKIVLVE